MTIAIVSVFAWFLGASMIPAAQRVRQAYSRRDESDQAMVFLREDIAWVSARRATFERERAA